MSEFWEELSYKLLEMNLYGDTLNSHLLQQLFKSKPEVLDEMDFGEGTSIENLDSQLYSGKPDIVEVRQAKANELFECIPC